MTELNWDGKYDKDGRKIAPVRISLPFQTIETVNESAQDRELTLELFSQGKATDWRNRLIWGDKKYVLPSLLPEFAGKVNLIYIDPPFFTGTDQLLTVKVPDSEQAVMKAPSIMEEAAYRNVWRQGSSSFCAWMYETLCYLHELLADDGAIFIRFDQYWSHYVKVIADEVFAKENFQNDIAVKRIYKNFTNQGRRSIQIATDSLLLYFKSDTTHFCDISQKLKEQRPGYWRRIDDSSGVRNPPERVIFGETYHPPAGKHFKFGQEKINHMLKEGKIRINDKGRPEYWVEATDTKPLTSNWTDISGYSFTTGYPTENSEKLLERSIRACSNVGDLVLDCFVGSGTTAAVAEKLNRRWIGCDLGRYAIHTTRKRLLSIEGFKPFVVQNLGKYERQAWMSAEFHGEARAVRQRAYRNFILNLYRATPINGYVWLHGVLAGRMVHVGPVDAPITLGDVKAVVTEFWKFAGKGTEVTTNGVDILGWEFAFELNEVAVQIAAEANVNLSFKKIPREVLEKRAVDQGDIRFFELAALSVDLAVNQQDARSMRKTKVCLKLTDFVIPPDDVPTDIQQAITHWSQWIDYWAVDWDFRNDTFHNQWQSYRTKEEPDLQKEVTHTYVNPGGYTVMVKVIDILGNDTTKAIEVNIK